MTTVDIDLAGNCKCTSGSSWSTEDRTKVNGVQSDDMVIFNMLDYTSGADPDPEDTDKYAQFFADHGSTVTFKHRSLKGK
jgi:hypothetical protein